MLQDEIKILTATKGSLERQLQIEKDQYSNAKQQIDMREEAAKEAKKNYEQERKRLEDGKKAFDSQLAREQSEIQRLDRELKAAKGGHDETKSSLSIEITKLQTGIKDYKREIKKLNETNRRLEGEVANANTSARKITEEREKFINTLNNKVATSLEKEKQQTLQIAQMSDKFLYLGVVFCMAIVSIFVFLK